MSTIRVECCSLPLWPATVNLCQELSFANRPVNNMNLREEGKKAPALVRLTKPQLRRPM